MKIKVCKQCGKIFETTNNKRLYCSVECGNKFRNLKFYSNHPHYERDRNRTKRTTLDGYKYQWLAKIKCKCKKLNIPFNLTIEDFTIPEYCPVLNIKLNYNHSHSGFFPDSPSIDRIIPELGYIKGNIRIISNRANLLKNNATIAELELIISDLRNIRGW